MLTDEDDENEYEDVENWANKYVEVDEYVGTKEFDSLF